MGAELDKLEKVKDRAYGTKYIDLIDQETAALKREIEEGGELPRAVKEVLNTTSLSGIINTISNVIDIDDYELKEKFIIFASSSEAAYNVITPRVIEVVLKFENLYSGNVSFYFLEGFLYVFINGSRISLNPTLSTPIDESFVDSIYSQVKYTSHNKSSENFVLIPLPVSSCHQCCTSPSKNWCLLCFIIWFFNNSVYEIPI